MITVNQPSFSGGEVSSSVYPRTDLAKYATSLRTCRNFIVHPQGGVSNRCGTMFIEEAKHSASTCVATDFVFNQEQAYVLEFGDQYVRFYTDGARVENNGVAYEVETPYLEEDLQDLRFESSADVIFITHPDYQTQTLTRYGNADWRLEEYEADDGPFMPENIDESVSLSVAAVSGSGVTLTVSSVSTPDTNTQLLLHFDGVDESTSFTDETGKVVTSYGNARISTDTAKFGGSSGFFNGGGIDSYNKLMLHFNGFDGSTVFTDSETTPKTVTAAGTAQIDTAQSKFGVASGLFDGSGWLTLADHDDWNLGSGDFSVDCWFRLSSVADTQYLFIQRDDSDNIQGLLLNPTSGTINFAARGSAVTQADYTATGLSLSANTWYHIEITRNGTNFYMFLNGASLSLTTNTAISTNTLPNLTSLMAIGARYTPSPGGAPFYGWIEEFRWSKGVARHTANFTVAVDEYSTGDYLSTPDSTDFSFGTGDFTVDFWVKFNDVSETQFIVCQYADSSNYWGISLTGSKLKMHFIIGGVVQGSYVMTNAWSGVVGTWYHLAFVRHGTTGNIFIDGTSSTVSTTTSFAANDVGNVAGSLYISQAGDSTSYLKAYLEEFRISKGTARWLANFTPSTSAHTLFNTTSAFNFSPLHVGALFKLRHYVEGQTATAAFSSATSSSSIRCFTTWRIITHGTWTGKIRVEKSIDSGTTWTVLRSFSSTDDFNANTSGTEDVESNPVPFLVRVTMYSYTSGTCNVDLTTDAFYQDGIVRTTSFVSVTSMLVTVIDQVGSTLATSTWSEGSWSDYRGYPSVSRFYQDRLCFANTDSEPQTIWMTQTGDYYSFRRNSTLLDTDGITVNLPSRQLNAINGLVAFRKLLAFTSASVWSVGPLSGAALTPTSIQTDIEEYSGSANVDQMVVGSEAIFVQSDNEVIRNIGYKIDNDGFVGNETNIIAKHLFEGYTITKMAYQSKPNSIIWCLRDDGVLLGMTYMAEQQVVAWTRHDTDGVVESICVIPATETDELWMVVNRSNGRFIEKMDGRKQFNIDGHVFMDSYVTAEDTTLVVSNLEHLYGKSVSILADGEVLDSQTVPESGTLNVGASYDQVSIGLPFEADLETLSIDIPTKEGTMQGSMVKVGNVTFRVVNTRGGYVGPNENTIYEAFDYAKLNSENWIENEAALGATENYSGDIRVPLGSEYKRGGRIFYRQSKPLPVSIGSISPEIELGGKKS